MFLHLWGSHLELKCLKVFISSSKLPFHTFPIWRKPIQWRVKSFIWHWNLIWAFHFWGTLSHTFGETRTIWLSLLHWLEEMSLFPKLNEADDSLKTICHTQISAQIWQSACCHQHITFTKSRALHSFEDIRIRRSVSVVIHFFFEALSPFPLGLRLIYFNICQTEKKINSIGFSFVCHLKDFHFRCSGQNLKMTS